MQNEETSRFPFCPEMGCLLAHFPDAKRLGSAVSFLSSAFCLLRFLCLVPAHVVSKRAKKIFRNMARRMLCQITMSSFESTDERKALPIELGGGENHRQNRPPDADRHISLTLAHELNNILTVVQGHAERLFAKHQADSALTPGLKKIAEAARHAAELVRSAPKLDSIPPTS